MTYMARRIDITIRFFELDLRYLQQEYGSANFERIEHRE